MRRARSVRLDRVFCAFELAGLPTEMKVKHDDNVEKKKKKKKNVK